MVTDVNAAASIAAVGETIQVLAGSPIPARCLAVGVIVAVPGPRAEILRIVTINTEDAANPTYTLSSLVVRGRRAYTKVELEAIRPLGFVIPDRSWRALCQFKEGGIYQAWPNGRVFRVLNRHLVDPVTGGRVGRERDRTKLSTLFPVFIERWVPPVPPAPTPTEPGGDDDA